jgi:muconate cycloisomerase
MNTFPLRIHRIETRIIDHALRADRIIVSPAGRHDQSRFLLVTVFGDDDQVGYGEAATTTLWSGEAAETAQWMVEQVFAPRLIGHSFDHPAETLAVMDGLAYGNPFAKSAVDTAMWDLWAKQQNTSVAQLIKDREPVAAIPTRASIGVNTVEETLRIATGLWEAGIKTLKFKIGAAELDDVGRLRAVREALGDEPVFTVDANGGYPTADSAVAGIEALLPYNIVLVEQPTPRDRIAMLAEVRRRIEVPMMADECVFTPGHLAEALDRDAFDILSVYPGKNGGFTRALEMAQTVRRAGKQCAIGSNLETDIGQAAMAALAAALEVFPVATIPCDLPATLFYEQSSVREPLLLRDGSIEVPAGNGFGVEPL